MERLVGADDVLDAWNIRSVPRPTAGSNENVFGPYLFAGREPHGVRILEYGTRLDDHDARALESGRVSHFESRDFAVFIGDQVGPVESRCWNAPAVTGSILEILRITRGIDQQFLRHTTANDAGAADPILFGHKDPRAVAGCDPRSTNTARSRTNDEEIDLAIRHAFPRARPPMPRAPGLQVVPFLLDLGAHLANDLFRNFVRPHVHHVEGLLKNPWLRGGNLLANR